jgi:hypothetical protein
MAYAQNFEVMRQVGDDQEGFQLEGGAFGSSGGRVFRKEIQNRRKPIRENFGMFLRKVNPAKKS